MRTKKKKLEAKVSYEEAQVWAKLKEIKSRREWFSKASERPENIPGDPAKFYAEDWSGWEDFLGKEKNDRQKNIKVSFEEAALFAKKNNIKSSNEWAVFEPLPSLMPRSPDRVYDDWAERGGWKGFLSLEFSYKAARKIVRKFDLFNEEEFKQMLNTNTLLPSNFPCRPDKLYGAEFSWEDFLGHKEHELEDIRKLVKELIQLDGILDLIKSNDDFADVLAVVRPIDQGLAIKIENTIGLKLTIQSRFLNLLKTQIKKAKGPLIEKLKNEIKHLKQQNEILMKENQELKHKG